MIRLVTVALIVLVTAALAWTVTDRHLRADGARAQRIIDLDRARVREAAIRDSLRVRVALAEAATDRRAARHDTAQAAADRTADTLRTALAAAETALADSAATAAHLRVVLADVTATARTMLDSLATLRLASDAERTAWRTERTAWRLRAASDSTQIAIDAALIGELREAARCRIVWRVPCPSRRAVLVGGLVLGATVSRLRPGT